MELKKNNLTSIEDGFTLIEVLIGLAIIGIVSATILSSFQSQQRSYIVQENVAAMQQNLRAGMDMMVREIRMAGYDPTGKDVAGIESAGSNVIIFSKDKNGDEDTDDSNEYITYSLFTSNGIQQMGRKSVITATVNEPMADNIEALEFFYTLADSSQTLNPADLTAIRSIRVTMLARTERQDKNFMNTRTYTTPGGQNWGPYNDNFRRRLLTTSVKCRNMGL
jgi:type IV pilus assembly protein PilW